MKVIFSIFVVILLAIVALADSESEKENAEMLEKFASLCYGQDGTTKEDFEFVFIQGKDPETMPQKCLITCMQEKVEIIKDNKFQPETFKQITKASIDDSQHDPIIDDIAKVCSAVTDANRCEQGMKLSLCYKETAEKHGVDFKKLQGM